ncbi:MAG: hypothetical protein ACE1Y9_04285, partial [Acidimicrobiia bacterium]
MAIAAVGPSDADTLIPVKPEPAPGQFMKIANNMGLKAYGLEADERYKKKNVIIQDLWKHKGKYDVVFNSFIMEHMEDQQK